MPWLYPRLWEFITPLTLYYFSLLKFYSSHSFDLIFTASVSSLSLILFIILSVDTQSFSSGFLSTFKPFVEQKHIMNDYHSTIKGAWINPVKILAVFEVFVTTVVLFFTPWILDSSVVACLCLGLGQTLGCERFPWYLFPLIVCSSLHTNTI